MSNLPANKFLVNRDKMRDANMQRSQAQQHWETIQDAIYKIYNKQASSLSYEELYRTAYSLVLHKHGQMLYESACAARPMAAENREAGKKPREIYRFWAEAVYKHALTKGKGSATDVHAAEALARRVPSLRLSRAGACWRT